MQPTPHPSVPQPSAERVRSPRLRALRRLLAGGLAAALVVAACGGDDDTSTATSSSTTSGAAGRSSLTGAVTAPADAPALPDGAELTVTLDEFASADQPSTIVDELTVTVADDDFPLAFELSYDPAALNEDATYSVNALVISDGAVLLLADPVPVLTEGAPTSGIEVSLRSLDSGDGGESSQPITWPGVDPNREAATAEQAAEWQALFEEALASADGLPGVWVALAHPELGSWSAAIGEAVAGERAAALDDHSRIGSTTKTFTAVAVLQQVAAGTLSLDDTVADVVPDLAEQFPATAAITVEQLLSMTSGLPDYANVEGGAVTQVPDDPQRVWTPEDLIASALEASPVEAPGTAGYSTTNYTILGEMLAAVTGQTVDEVLTDVATRAGLDATGLLPTDQNDLPDPSSHGYVEPAGVDSLAEVGATVEAGTDVTDWSLSWGGAGGGMYSAVEDLFEWAASGSGTSLLPDDLARTRLTFDTDLGSIGTYGLGIQQLSPGWIGHVGQVIGWESMAFYEPASGATFALLVNGTGSLQRFLPVWSQIFGVPI